MKQSIKARILGQDGKWGEWEELEVSASEPRGINWLLGELYSEVNECATDTSTYEMSECEREYDLNGNLVSTTYEYKLKGGSE